MPVGTRARVQPPLVARNPRRSSEQRTGRPDRRVTSGSGFGRLALRAGEMPSPRFALPCFPHLGRLGRFSLRVTRIPFSFKRSSLKQRCALAVRLLSTSCRGAPPAGRHAARVLRSALAIVPSATSSILSREMRREPPRERFGPRPMSRQRCECRAWPRTRGIRPSRCADGCLEHGPGRSRRSAVPGRPL